MCLWKRSITDPEAIEGRRFCNVGAAIAGSAVASVAGSAIQAGASGAAASNISGATNKAVQGLQPYNTYGQAILPNLYSLAQGGPTALSTLQQTPGYQFTLQQGLQGVENGYTAMGLGRSGAALKGAANYAEGLASTTYNNVFNNMYNLASLGENAGAGAGSLGISGTSTAGQALVGAGNALAGGLNSAGQYGTLYGLLSQNNNNNAAATSSSYGFGGTPSSPTYMNDTGTVISAAPTSFVP